MEMGVDGAGLPIYEENNSILYIASFYFPEKQTSIFNVELIAVRIYSAACE